MNKKLTTLIGGIALISSAAFAQTTTGQSGSQSGASDSSGVTSSSRSDVGAGTGMGTSSPSQSGSSNPSQSSQSGIQGGPNSSSPQGFSSLDKDSSGEISRREAASQQSLSRIFDRADENKDGQLSQSEYQQAVSPEETSVQ